MSEITGRKLMVTNDSFFLEGYADFSNKRLKIEDFRGDICKIVNQISSWSKASYVEKVIVKSRNEYVPTLLEYGFVLEAVVPGYFLGSDMCFFCKYLSEQRYNSAAWCEEDEILEKVSKKKQYLDFDGLDSEFLIRKARVSDAEKLSALYTSVFQIYPVPIEDPAYIKQQMKQGTVFMILEKNESIIAAASAEINQTYKNAEITDCATLPQYRGGGFMKYIILELEKVLVANQVFCSYSIARALSFGMNATLKTLTYTYSGRLKNNCYIYDKIEDMNVWHKNLNNGSADISASAAES